MSTTVIPAGESEEGNEFDSRAQYLADQEREQESDVLSGLRELEGAEGARWRIFRIGSDDPSLNGFLDEVGTVQLSATFIRDKFGGGKYRVRGHLAGSGRILAHRTIEIAGDAPRRQPQVAGIQGTGSQVASSFEDWERREEIRAEKRRKERMELLAIIVPAVTPLAAAMIGRQGPDMTALIAALKPPPPPDPIALLTQLKALNAGESAQSSPLDTAFKLMDKLQDLSPPEGGTGWMDVLKELVKTAGPTLAPVLEGAIQRAAQNTAVGTPVPVPTNIPIAGPAVAGPAISVADSSENPPMLGMLALLPWLKEQMTMALNKAANGSDPGLIAERILDDLPRTVKPEQLLEFIQRPDWFQQLQRFDPKVATYGPWFASMRTAMLEEITGEAATNPQIAPTQPVPPMSVTPVESGSSEVDKPQAPPKLGL